MADPNRDNLPLVVPPAVLSSNAAVVGAPLPTPSIDAEAARMRATAEANVRAQANAGMVAGMQSPQMGLPAPLPYTAADAARTAGPAQPPVQPAQASYSNEGYQGVSPRRVQAIQDNQEMSRVGGNIGAAMADMISMPVRGAVGAANTLIRGVNAMGVDVPYIPAEAGGQPFFDASSLTPFYDRRRAAGLVDGEPGVVSAARAATPQTPGNTASYSNEGYNRGLVKPDAPAPASQAAVRTGGSGSGGARAAAPPPVDDGVGSWARYAAQDRSFFDPFGRGGGGGAGAGLSAGQRGQLAYSQAQLDMLKDLSQSTNLWRNKAMMGAAAHALGVNNMTGQQSAEDIARINAAAHLGAARIGAGAAGANGMWHYMANQDTIAAAKEHDARTPVQGGATLAQDPVTGLSVPVPTMGFSTYDRAAGRASYTPIGAEAGRQQSRAMPKEGARQQYQGKGYVYRSGKWEAE